MRTNLLFNRVCEKFNLGLLKHASKINNGFSSNCYKLVTSKSKYLVKVYTIDKLKNVTSTAKTEFFFKKGNLPVLTRISNLDESDHLIIGGNIFIVFPYVVIPKIKKWQKELYYELGDFLGKMHRYSIKVSSKNNFETFNLDKTASPSLRSMYLLLDILCSKKRMNKQGRLAVYNLMVKIDYLKKILLEKFILPDVTLIHGDFHPGNLCIKDNKIKMIYDFDSYCFRSIYYELAKVIIGTCFNGSFDDKNFVRTEYFLRGYQRHVILKPNILRTAIQICHFEVFNSFWIEEKWSKKPTIELVKLMEKEKQALNYFVNINNLNNFTERICNFLNKNKDLI